MLILDLQQRGWQCLLRFLSEDIQKCQTKGKIETLSLGSETTKVGFQSDSQAEELIWNLFLGTIAACFLGILKYLPIGMSQVDVSIAPFPSCF